MRLSRVLVVALLVLSSSCLKISTNANDNGNDSSPIPVVSASKFTVGQMMTWAHYRGSSPEPTYLERFQVLQVRGSTITFAAENYTPGDSAWHRSAVMDADLDLCVHERTSGGSGFALGWYQPTPAGEWRYVGTMTDTTVFDQHFNCVSAPHGGTGLTSGRVHLPIGETDVTRIVTGAETDQSEKFWFVMRGTYRGVLAERLIPITGEVVKLEAVSP